MWLFDKVIEVEGGRPGAADLDRRAEEVHEALRRAGLLATEPRPIERDAASHSKESPRFGRPHHKTAALLVSAAVAAAVLVAVGFLIGVYRVGRTSQSGGPVLLLASATPKFGVSRGTERPILVEVGSERPGFVTIVTLAADRRQQVFPAPDVEPDRVGPSAPATCGPLPPESTIALVVVTERDATEFIRDALLGKDYRASDRGRLESYLRERLSESGHRWVAMGVTSVGRASEK